MLNDVTFNNDKSAYLDWNIVLTQVEIPLPVPKTSSTDIKGMDGLLDYSEALSNDIKYNNRTAKLTFELMDISEYTSLISKISNYLHGKMVTFVLNNDDSFYYQGRATVNSWECSKNKGSIVITVDCYPYKHEINESVFIISVENENIFTNLPNLRKKVCPVLEVTGSITMKHDGYEYELEEGVQQYINFILNEGDNVIEVSGTGSLKVTYLRGSL